MNTKEEIRNHLAELPYYLVNDVYYNGIVEKLLNNDEVKNTKLVSGRVWRKMDGWSKPIISKSQLENYKRGLTETLFPKVV